MNSLSLKLRHIYLPFLLVYLFVVVGYSLLFWLLVVRSPVLVLDKLYVDILFPLIAAYVCEFIWIRPRMQLLVFSSRTGSSAIGFTVIGAAGIALTTIMVVRYIKDGGFGVLQILLSIIACAAFMLIVILIAYLDDAKMRRHTL